MKKIPARNWVSWITVPGVVLVSSLPGYAVTYLTVEQAQQTIFPGQRFIAFPLVLTDAQRSEIKKKSSVSVRVKEIKAWHVAGVGIFIVDEVLGKHEFITYAIGIQPDGSVKQVEIMDYRESYGYEIRNENWREQFIGKTAESSLKLDSDIKNISGATLSCRHIADGVKRVLATYEIALT